MEKGTWKVCSLHTYELKQHSTKPQSLLVCRSFLLFQTKIKKDNYYSCKLYAYKIYSQKSFWFIPSCFPHHFTTCAFRSSFLVSWSNQIFSVLFLDFLHPFSSCFYVADLVCTFVTFIWKIRTFSMFTEWI